MAFNGNPDSLFQRVSADTMKKNIDNIGKYTDDYDSILLSTITQYKIKDNVKCRFRIAPPHPESRFPDFMVEVPVHEYFGGSGGYICINKWLKQRCPLCDKNAQARMEENEELSKKLRWKSKFVMLGFDMDPEPQSLDLMALIAPPKLKDFMLAACDTPTDGIHTPSDIYEGKELVWQRTKGKGESFGSYTSAQLGYVIPLAPYEGMDAQQMAEAQAFWDILQQQLVPIESIFKIPTEAELEEVAKYIITTKAEAESPKSDRVTTRFSRSVAPAPASAPVTRGAVPPRIPTSIATPSGTTGRIIPRIPRLIKK